MRAVFISYRREDVEGHAGRLFQDLATHFGKDAIFMDVAGIEPGRDFRKVIDHQVGSCGVLLALIGKTWLNCKNEAGLRRLEDPVDFVRLETAAALKRDIPVIPVLVHGSKMPRAEDLPGDLKDLAYRNAVELTHARWQSDVQLLINALRPYVGSREDKGVASDAPSSPAVDPRPSYAGSDMSRASLPGGVPAATMSQMATVPWRSILLAGIATVAVAAGGYVAYGSFSAQKAEKVAAEKAAADKAAVDRAAADRAAADRAAAERAAADKAAAAKAAAAKAASAPCVLAGKVFDKSTGQTFPAVVIDVFHYGGNVRNMPIVESRAATTGPDGAFRIRCDKYAESDFPLMFGLSRADWTAQHIVGDGLARDRTDQDLNFGIAPEVKKKDPVEVSFGGTPGDPQSLQVTIKNNTSNSWGCYLIEFKLSVAKDDPEGRPQGQYAGPLLVKFANLGAQGTLQQMARIPGRYSVQYGSQRPC